MKRKVPVLVAFTTLALMVAAPLWAQNPWIHVRVEDSGKKASKVHVNLPLSVVQAALEVAPEKIVKWQDPPPPPRHRPLGGRPAASLDRAQGHG